MLSYKGVIPIDIVALIRNPKEIVIPPDTLVVLCGTSQAGKSTLVDQKFHDDRVTVVSSDAIFEKLVSEILRTTNDMVQISPSSDIWPTIAHHLGRIAVAKLEEMIIPQVLASESSITVLDYISLGYAKRVNELLGYSRIFSHVFLVVVKPPLETILQRESRPISAELASLGFYRPQNDAIQKDYEYLESEIQTGHITHGVEKVFILEKPDDVQILF